MTTTAANASLTTRSQQHDGTVPPAFRSTQSCVERSTGGRHQLTLAQARACAPGAPELTSTAPVPATAPDIFITTAADHVLINYKQVRTTAPAGPIGPAACGATWKSWTQYFSDGIGWASLTGNGYGDHCGYSNFPNNPTPSVSCPGCFGGWNGSWGTYDNNYGQAHYGQNYAADWANLCFYAGPGGGLPDCFGLRVFIDPNANIWGATY